MYTVPETSAAPTSSPARLLESLSSLATRLFESEQEFSRAALDAIADQVGVRTPFLSSTQAGLFEIVDVVNRQGCNLQSGATLPLPDSY
ncbi:MAG TPA: hypothetical protein VH186_10485 [Chloroflexia bacterium]|nr:hypothetical protein [Chloroflexia bacterium]